MSRCRSRGSCHGCCDAVHRRRFLQDRGAVAASGSLMSFARASAAEKEGERVRVAAVGKLFGQWHRFGWHRVTVYGDVKQPLAEFGRALGLEVIEEA